MKKQRLEVDPSSVQYIRYYFPRHFTRRPMEQVVEQEQSIWRRNAFLKEFFFFGVNFLAVKQEC